MAFAPAQPAICARLGCSNPTFNGRRGEFCSRKCRGSAPVPAAVPAAPVMPLTCPRLGCNKQPWNGVPGEYCSKKCRAAGPTPAASGSVSAATKPVPAASAQKPATCAASGCQRASWNGKSGECCSVECRDQYNKEISRFAKDPGSVMCARQGCNNQPWNGMQGEYCMPLCWPCNSGSSCKFCARSSESTRHASYMCKSRLQECSMERQIGGIL